jgi:hypothetical protein
VCYEEAVVEMNIHVGDDDVGVEKSPKKWEATRKMKNERPPREEREAQEVSGRELGLGLQFHPSLVRHVYKIDSTKHTS